MSVIDEVKSRIDIVDLVGEQVALQRAGRNYKARCPFHNEKTPSFYVSPDRQTWHCFGACGTGGDILTFVMKREGIEFGEALRVLARRAGVSLAERQDPQEDERRQRLLAANEAASAFFHHALLHSSAAEAARSYLTSRGLDPETTEAFQLGYGPESWDALKSHLIERGFTGEELLAAGLLVESERGGYDRFRGRLMFPIRDGAGRVVGFGGRALTADAPGAKYINTPQTPMFDKGGLLYALDRAKEAVRREGRVIVVEGYMDVLAAHQHGITNVVASMGTALTERQIRTLERLKAEILLAMDPDIAGVMAGLRGVEQAAEAGAARATSASVHPDNLSADDFAERAREWSRDALKRATVNFYVVPLSGKDPDELIRSDRAAWDAAVANARPFTEHVFATVAAGRDLSQPRERSELLQELLPVVRLIEEPVYRAHYVQRLARLALVDEEVIRSALRRGRGRRPQRAEPAPASLARHDPGEEFCLALLLRHSELRREAEALSPDLFSLGEHRAILAAWRETADIDSLREALPAELHPQLEPLLKRDLPVYEGEELRRAFEDCVRRIEFRRLSAAKRASTAALADVEAPEGLIAVIEEARALLESETRENPEHPPSERDTHRSELAVTLVEDMKVGRRLHQAPPSRHVGTEPSQASPPSEDRR